MSKNEIAVQRLTEHWRTYPRLQAEDIFKYLFQSSFGCEHLVTNEAAALNYVTREYGGTDKNAPPRTEALDGKYSRVHLSWLNAGLSAETLTKIFCASAKSEPNGRDELLQKLEVSTEMVKNGDLPLDAPTFLTALTEWRDLGFPALHHSEVFRSEYRPAYRVVANEYATFLPLFAEIDRLLVKGAAIVAIEGGSASGKSTLADMLKRIYGCNVFHTDDFFLRPEQRTPRRLAEVGGNLDRERFSDEVLIPLSKGQPISYRKFDCQTGNLAEPITVVGAPLTIIEGMMHRMKIGPQRLSSAHFM